MTPQDYLYKQVFDRCLAAGVLQHRAGNAASHAVGKFHKNDYRSVKKLADSCVSAAKKNLI